MGGVVASGVESGSSKTISYSVMKREKTGAGMFNVGEKTIPTDTLIMQRGGIPFRIVILFSWHRRTIRLKWRLKIRSNSKLTLGRPRTSSLNCRTRTVLSSISTIRQNHQLYIPTMRKKSTCRSGVKTVVGSSRRYSFKRPATA